MKGGKEIRENQGRDVASFHHKQVSFAFPFCCRGCDLHLLLAKEVLFFYIAFKSCYVVIVCINTSMVQKRIVKYH